MTHEQPKTTGIVISTRTLLPVSFVILIIGATLYISKIQSTTEANAKEIQDIKNSFVTQKILDLSLQPLTEGINSIKTALKIPL